MSLLEKVSGVLVKETEVSKVIQKVKVGDLVKVLYKTVGDSLKTRKIVGVCVGKYQKGEASYIKLKLELVGVKLYYTFPVNSNKIISLEVMQKEKFKINKAKG